MYPNQNGSRRWQHFHSALQLAVQRSAHKWTREDFAECFPLYVEEDKDGSDTTFNSISDFIEAKNLRDLDKLMKVYNVQENIDTLHQVINDGKARKEQGTVGNDVWQENLEPRSAIAARTVPVLKREAERLKELIAEVEEENRTLDAELKSKTQQQQRVNEQMLEFLDKLDVAQESWSSIPQEEIEEWAVLTAESVKAND